ncbi:MAG: transglutaminase-like domain-containing protein [Ruminococcus sp.]|nr:transglutaminase-like domain-containing protein [Ruminococcus sp.]
MSAKQNKALRSGQIQCENGISFRSDVAFTSDKNSSGIACDLMRLLMTFFSSLGVILMIDSFLESDAYSYEISNLFNVVVTILLTELAAYLTMKKGVLPKVIGAAYLFFNTAFILLNMESVVNGTIYTINCYTVKAKFTTPFFATIASEVLPSDVDMFALAASFLLTVLISLALIYRLNFPLLFIFTFPFFELGAFWGWETYSFAVVSLIASWIITLSLNLINHTTKERKSTASFAISPRKKTFYMTSDSLKSDFFNNAAKFLLPFVCLTLAITACAAYLSGNSRSESLSALRKDISSGFRELSEDISESTLISGFTPGRSKMVGGTNGGKLGVYDKITFSGTTALKVTASSSFKCQLYLRGYVGDTYEDNCWNPSKLDKSDSSIFSADDTIPLDYNYLKRIDYYNQQSSSLIAVDLTTTQISVKAVNAVKDLVYAPYDSYYSDCSNIDEQEYDGMISPDDTSKKYTLTTVLPTSLSWSSIIDDAESTAEEQNSYSDTDSRYITYDEYTINVMNRSGYFDVPDNLTDYLDEIIDYASVTSDDSLSLIESSFSDYFSENGFTYTLEPGVTPDDEDFIEYFLTVQREGYCTYYASTAVMLMRRLGFAARYVEGYVVSPDQFTADDETIKVSDRSAHAWCEVYIPDYGWYPIELTPGYQNDNPNLTDKERGISTTSSSSADSSAPDSSSSPDSDSSSKSASSSSRSESSSSSSKADSNTTDSIPSVSGSSSDTSGYATNTTADYDEGYHFELTAQALYTLLVIAFVLLVLIIILLRRKSKLAHLHSSINSRDLNQSVLSAYKASLRYLALVKITENGNITDTERASKIYDRLKDTLPELCDSFMTLSDCAISVYLSSADASAEDASLARTSLKSIQDSVYNRLTPSQRFAAKWLHCLY